MNENDRRLMAKIFASYYRQATLCVASPERREFGVGLHRKIESRHLAFANEGELRSYLCNNTPFFVSHSTSYYDFPAASPMEKKGWRGADLVFDLDIHSDGKYSAFFLLERVKEDLSRLVRDFIRGDFGCRDVTLAFSGNRGYHVHVRDRDFLPLGSDERRELADYVMGSGLDYLDFFSETGSRPAKLIGPRPDEGGYRGRFARATIRALNEKPSLISRKFSDEKQRAFFISGIEEGNWSKTSFRPAQLKQKLAGVAHTLPVATVNTDAGVTHDLSKLIRVPNSIHGETGLIARVFEDIDAFDPLRDALMPASQVLRIRFTEDVPQLPLRGETAGPFRKGEEKELNLAVAAFFVLKDSATLIAR